MFDFFSARRPSTLASEAMIATSHPLSTAAGLEILSAGGNAVDAAICAVSVQCVVDPLMTGIGGDCFALYAPKGGKVKALKKKIKNIERDAPAGPDSGADGPEKDLDAEMGGSDDEDDEQDVSGREGTLLGSLKIFLSREVPRQLLEVMAGAFGAQVGWEGEGSPFAESDQTITHQIVDRNTQRHLFLSREYVQPQWLADTVNAGLPMPVAPYGPGCVPPPHISPFVNDDEEG